MEKVPSKTSEAKKNERKVYKAAVIDATKLVEAQAKDLGDHRMTESKEDRGKSWITRKVTQFWKHNLFQEYYRHKKIAEARGEIIASDDLYKGEEGVEADAHSSAMNALIERFTSEYDDEMLKGAEKKTKQNTNEGANKEIKKLIEAYAADPKMTKEDFKEEQKRILSSVDKDYAKEKTLYADNLLAIATEVRDSVAHGEKLSEMDFEVELTLGKAQESLNTEAKQSFFEKMQNSKVGRIVMNEPTVAAACAAAYGIATKLSQRLASSKLAAWGSFGATAVLSGSMSAAKEAARVTRERAQHSREMAKGKTIDPKDMPRREEMEKNRYLTREASDIQAKLSTALVEVKAGRLDEASLAGIMADLADLETRIRLGDQKKIDLVTYSATGKVEAESTNLRNTRAELKVALRAAGAEKLADKAATGTFDDYLDKMVNIQTDALMGGENGIEAKDKIFRKMKRSSAAKAFVKTAVVGAVFGVTFQEAKDMVTGFFGGEDGLVSGMVKSTHDYFSSPANKWNNLSGHTSALEGLRRYMMGTDPRMPMGAGHDVVLGGTHMRLPDGVDIHPNPNGTFSIVNGNTVIANDLNLSLDAHGDLSDIAKQGLAMHGIHTSSNFVIGPGGEHATETAADYLKEHPELTHRVHRELWYDNDTPHPFDKNEIKEWWGGKNGTGVNENGDYVLSMKHMASDGSYHGAESVDAIGKMHAHGLTALFSLTKGTQHQVFEVPIDEHGDAIIPKGGELAKLMFETGKNGHAVFTGQFAEIAQQTGTAKDGGEIFRVLATHIGHGRDMVPGGIPAPDVTVNFDVPKPWDYDVPPFIPLVPRTPLERAGGRKPTPEKPSLIKGLEGSEGHEHAAYNERLKAEYTNLSAYRNSEDSLKKLEAKIEGDPELKAKYAHVFARLDEIRNFKALPPEKKAVYTSEYTQYHKRYKINPPLTLDNFLRAEYSRVNRQMENIALEEAKLGEKPFDKSFYENSALLKGLSSAKEVVVCLDDPIGDAVLTLPAIESLSRYFKQNGLKTELVIVTKHKKFLATLEDQYPGLKVITATEAAEQFKGDTSKRFVINANKVFEDYESLGLKKGDEKDPSKVMSVDWASWQKEEYPSAPGKKTKYDMLPARIARNFEVMLGQKLYEDINSTTKFIDRGKNFEVEKGELFKKYGISADEHIYTISAGSSVQPKEYQPEKWKEVIEGIVKRDPKAHILFLDDPDLARKEKYGKMADALVAEGIKISRVQEGMEKMNTIMSMSQGVITPDTGLGHYAGALGKPAVMLFLSDPVLWSTPGTVRVAHPKAYETYRKGIGSYNRAWDKSARNNYFVEEGGVFVGMSDVDSEKVVDKVFNKNAAEKKTEPKDRKSRLETARKAAEEAYKTTKKAVSVTPKITPPTPTITAPTLAPSPEPAPTPGKEKIGSPDIASKIKNVIKESLLDAGSSREIGKLDVVVNDGTIVVSGELSPSGTIELTLGVRTGNSFVFEGTPRVKAGFFARRNINRALAALPERLMEALAGKSKKLEGIALSGTDHSLTYNSK